MNRILIIGHGEQAIRLHQTYQNLGYETVGLYSKDNQDDPYIKQANTAIPISNTSVHDHKRFFYTYISIAKYTGCQFIHPGTGDLAFNYYFIKACELSDIILLGNLSESIKRLKSIGYNKKIGKLHKTNVLTVEKPFEEINILTTKRFQLIYSSTGTKKSSYMGSLEFYKRRSQSKNIYACSPCQSVQVDDFLNLNRICRTIIFQLQLIGIIYFDFIFYKNCFYLQAITPSISPFSPSLENRVNIDFIDYQADLFVNGKIKYINKQKITTSVSKNIFTIEDSIVQNIHYPGGFNINHNINAYNGKKIFKQSKFPLAIISAHGTAGVVNKLMEATRSFEIQTL